MAWDGCNRKTRRPLEDALMQLPACTEVFLVFLEWMGQEEVPSELREHRVRVHRVWTAEVAPRVQGSEISLLRGRGDKLTLHDFYRCRLARSLNIVEDLGLRQGEGLPGNDRPLAEYMGGKRPRRRSDALG